MYVHQYQAKKGTGINNEKQMAGINTNNHLQRLSPGIGTMAS